jgi:hypothetical protein
MRFKGLAQAMLARGIAVIPLKPNTKVPALVAHGVLDWTLDSNQVEAWDQQQANCNCAAVARPDGCWFLDIDDEAMIPKLLEETGQAALPETFTVNASRGPHLYFKQNDASRAMGNVKLSGVCDAQVSDKYVVAPNSMHPSGKRYEIAEDLPIIEAPEWLTTWLSKRASATAPTKGVPNVPNASSVDQSLVWVHAWMGANEVAALETPSYLPDGRCRIFVICPQKELHTTESGDSESAIIIAADGKLGFCCQHSHCGDLDWTKFRSNYDVEPTVTLADLSAFTGIVGAENVLPNKEQGEWRFDPASLYGPLGKLARQLKAPLGLVFPALITAYSINVPDTKDVRTNHYCGLLGQKGGFKGESAGRAADALHLPWRSENLVSDRGVEQALEGGGRVLIYQDEFENTIHKMAIKGSSLAGTLCQLWSSDAAGSADKHGVLRVSARMSLLGNVAINKQSDFKAVFQAETTKGLYDRFIFGCRDKGEQTEYTRRSLLKLEDLPDYPAVCVQVQDGRFDQMNAWVRAHQDEFPKLGGLGRLGEILLRVAVTLASANGETELSDGAFAAAAAFCSWQCRIRQYYQPSDAINLGAQIGEAITTFLATFTGASVPKKRVLNQVRKDLACSARDVLMEFQAMCSIGSIEFDKEQDLCWLEATS